MVAVALIGIISVGLVGVFANVSKAIQVSKTKSLASNLAQEQMQILKQRSFNRVLITTAAAFITPEFPSIPYDPGYYPPETISEGGIKFIRYTHVQVVTENSGALSYLSSVADTGMKVITVTVTWYEGASRKKLQLRNILANIDTTQSNSVFKGSVTISPTTTGISGALVTVAENVGWQDFTNATGAYQITLSPGTYRLVASARGYFSSFAVVSVAANGTTSANFPMVAMGSGTVTGSVWVNTRPVISAVVGSTMNSVGFCQEYVELFNPSTWTWTVASGPTTSVIDLKYQRTGQAFPTTIAMNFTNYTIPARSYYLYSNTGTVIVAGTSRTADAVFAASNAGYPDLILTAGGGGCGSSGKADAVSIVDNASSQTLDTLGWSQGGINPEMFETSPYPQGIGLEDNEQFLRKTSTSGVVLGLGRAYDSGDNSQDFIGYTPISFPPRNSSVSEPVVAGIPAVGAIVSGSDGLSQATTATLTGSPSWASFQLTSVATGTWNVIVASNDAILEISSVVVTANNTTNILNSITFPTWNYTGYNSVVLSSDASEGFISGRVTDSVGSAIASGINVGVGAILTPASSSNGMYFLRLSSGTYDVTANPNNGNSMYIAQTSHTLSVELGRIKSDVNFVLAQGGRMRGFVTRDGTNPLSGISIAAFDSNGNVRGQEVSAIDGRYLIVNISTGLYTVEPVLGSGETATPSSTTVTVTAGSTVSIATFTITGAFGTVRGNATASSQAIRTGVLVVCTTTTISGVPPTLSYASITGAGYYMTNTYEDGTYSLDVRGSTSTTYKLYAYYTTFTGSTSSTTVRSQTNVSITAGQTTSGVNFSW